MNHRALRRSSRPYRRQQRGQIMVLFALMLPVVVGFLALSMAASIELDTKASLDQAAISTAVSASSDACMTSPQAWDLFQCASGGVKPAYSTPNFLSVGKPAHQLDATNSGTLPAPPFTAGDAAHTTCNVSQPAPLPPAPDATCITDEQAIAQASATGVVQKVLQSDYPSFTVSDCSVPPLVCGTLANSTTVQFKVDVSYWYYWDTDDGGADPFSSTANPSDDSTSLTSASAQTCADGKSYTDPGPPVNTVDYDNNTGYGAACPDGDAGADDYTVKPDNSITNSVLVCPTTGQFSRLVRVQLWTQFLNPFGGILGIGKVVLHSTSQTFGCSG